MGSLIDLTSNGGYIYACTNSFVRLFPYRSLDQESSSLCPSTNVATAPPTSSAALLSGAASLTTSAAAAAAASSNGKTSGALALPGNLHMTSEPPDYWIGKVAMENVSLRSAKTSRCVVCVVTRGAPRCPLWLFHVFMSFSKSCFLLSCHHMPQYLDPGGA